GVSASGDIDLVLWCVDAVTYAAVVTEVFGGSAHVRGNARLGFQGGCADVRRTEDIRVVGVGVDPAVIRVAWFFGEDIDHRLADVPFFDGTKQVIRRVDVSAGDVDKDTRTIVVLI